MCFARKRLAQKSFAQSHSLARALLTNALELCSFAYLLRRFRCDEKAHARKRHSHATRLTSGARGAGPKTARALCWLAAARPKLEPAGLMDSVCDLAVRSLACLRTDPKKERESTQVGSLLRASSSSANALARCAGDFRPAGRLLARSAAPARALPVARRAQVRHS